MPQRKFFVLSNGLRNHLGHYLETSLAVAEAARKLGFHPVLAAHVECRRDCLPDWLECHATFRTDHWVDDPPPGYAAARPRVSPFWAHGHKALDRGSRWARRAAYYLLPPLFYDLGGRVTYELGRLAAYCCLPRIAAPAERAHAAAALRRRALRLRYGRRAELMEQAADWPELTRVLKLAGDGRAPCAAVAAPSVAAFRPDALAARRADLPQSAPAGLPSPAKVMDAARRLLPEGFGRELEYALVFYQDLERFLTATAAGPGDHVWLGTAHAREVLAVHWIVEQFGAEQSPVFHLEFRHALFACDAGAPQVPIETTLTPMQRRLLQLHAEWGANDRMRFYTDSAALSRDHESIVDLSFGVLPLPFRAHLVQRRARRAGSPLIISYLGEARDEKGFPLLPGLIEALMPDYVVPGKVRFLLQANVSQPQFNPRSTAALKRLRRQAGPGVELLARDAPLSPEAYHALISQADIVILPYAVEAYQARTSGAMGEALAAGAAVVATAGTWLAEQLPPGCGETFDDPETLAVAVKRIVDNFHAYQAAAEAHRPIWRQRHSPEALVAALTGDGSVPSCRAAA